MNLTHRSSNVENLQQLNSHHVALTLQNFSFSDKEHTQFSFLNYSFLKRIAVVSVFWALFYATVFSSTFTVHGILSSDVGRSIVSDSIFSRILVDSSTCNVTLCESTFSCNCESISDPKPVWMTVLEWIGIVFLVMLSAIFSGLTLGLMSLDLIGLDIVIGGDLDGKDAGYARKIKPIRARGNLLLCTLLIGNVSSNSLMSILLADKTSGALGFILSTFIIVIFGEIFPQAICSRNALLIGAKTINIVKFFMVILFPIAFPIASLLDCILKLEIGNVYSAGQLKKLVEIHKEHNKVDGDQARMIDGALTYKEKSVEDIMTPKEDMFMLKMHDTLNFETMSRIFQSGYSRVPVYDNEDTNNVVGLVLTKDMILIDPEDNTAVSSVMHFFGRELHYLWPDTCLPDAMRLFRSGRTHIAIVRTVNNDQVDCDPFYETVGLITLEDIIEEILQEEIRDETDAPENNTTDTITSSSSSINVDSLGNRIFYTPHIERLKFDFERLQLLDTNSHSKKLTQSEKSAITAHICDNLSYFKSALARGSITREQVSGMVEQTELLLLKKGEILYKANTILTHCVLILSGSLDVVSGAEGFRSTIGQWTFVGQTSLETQTMHSPMCDFTATVFSDEGLRCVRINRDNFESMLRINVQKTSNITDGSEPEPHEFVDDVSKTI